MSDRERSPWEKMMSRNPNNDDRDFFPTPYPAIEALLRAQSFHSLVWEPACGDGAISSVLWDHGYKVLSTDLYHYGYTMQVGYTTDFFSEEAERMKGYYDIITNPPYKYHREFIERALELAYQYVAMLLPLTYMTPKNKRELYTERCKTSFYPLGFRPGFIMPGRTKSSKMKDYMWVVWDTTSYPTKTHQMQILEKPDV